MRTYYYTPWGVYLFWCRMTELHKMEEDEEQGFLEDVDKLQTREEHAQNLSILKDQKDKRTRRAKRLPCRSVLLARVCSGC